MKFEEQQLSFSEASVSEGYDVEDSQRSFIHKKFVPIELQSDVRT